MVKVNELPAKAARETYVSFRNLKGSFGSEEFNFVLFYGNPTGNAISWCPDCETAHTDFMRFANHYEGPARFHTVPVGSREEFDTRNPFLGSDPHIEGVPTLAVYKGNVTYLKLVDPTFEDIAYFAKKHKL